MLTANEVHQECVPETLAAFVARLGILCTAHKVRGPITCRLCGGDRSRAQWVKGAKQGKCPDCLNQSHAAPKDGDDWKRCAVEWRIVLHCNGEMMELPYWTGNGIKTEPTAADVLDNLAAGGDSRIQSFEDWAGDFGYDTDSRTAERLYLECQKLDTQLERFLGRLDYRTLLDNVERL